jgi:hypothetical protein
MTDLTKLSPSEVDTIYLERLAALQRAWREVEYASLAVLRESGRGITVEVANRKGYPVHETVYVHPSFGQTLQAWYRTYKLDDVRVHVLTVERCLAEGLAPAAAAKLAQAEAACRDAQAACHEVETEYDRRPWSRYWLVTSSDGHIHRSTCCSTCNKGLNRTGFALTPFLSGKADSDAVADLGPALCSVCFPEAPVESKEQARIPARLALALAEEGVEAFQKARQEAAAKQAATGPSTSARSVASLSGPPRAASSGPTSRPGSTSRTPTTRPGTARPGARRRRPRSTGRSKRPRRWRPRSAARRGGSEDEQNHLG